MSNRYNVECKISDGVRYYSVYRLLKKADNCASEKVFVTPFLSAPKAIQSICDYYNAMDSFVSSLLESFPREV